MRSEKGHGGGWTLARDLSTLTLLDIHRGIGSPPLFAIGNRSASPECAVEQAVNEALDSTLHQAEALLLASFGEITLASLSRNFERRLAERAATSSSGDPHAR